MKSLRLALLLCLLAIAAVVVPVSAQDNSFGLSAEDYALLTGVQAPESAAYDLSTAMGLDFDGTDVNFDLNGSGLFGGDLFSLILGGTISSDGSDTELNIELRAVDGSLYISPDGGENWFGGTMEEYEQMLSGFTSMMSGSLPVNPEDLASGDMSALMSQPGVMEAMMAASSIDPSTFTTIVRDADVDGNAHFVTTVDIGALISSPELAPAIAAMAASTMGTTANDLTEEQLQQMSGMMAGMFQGSSVTVDQYIDPATGQLEGLTFALTFTIPNSSGAGGTLNLNFDIAFSDAGGATVEAPASFEPISQVMGAMMGGM